MFFILSFRVRVLVLAVLVALTWMAVWYFLPTINTWWWVAGCALNIPTLLLFVGALEEKGSPQWYNPMRGYGFMVPWTKSGSRRFYLVPVFTLVFWLLVLTCVRVNIHNITLSDWAMGAVIFVVAPLVVLVLVVLGVHRTIRDRRLARLQHEADMRDLARLRKLECLYSNGCDAVKANLLPVIAQMRLKRDAGELNTEEMRTRQAMESVVVALWGGRDKANVVIGQAMVRLTEEKE